MKRTKNDGAVLCTCHYMSVYILHMYTVHTQTERYVHSIFALVLSLREALETWVVASLDSSLLCW